MWHVCSVPPVSRLKRLGLAEKFEVAIARHSRSSEIVLNDENRDRGVLGNYDGAGDATKPSASKTPASLL
jgi:hypothetical protein